jgi:hypothetical protein
MSPKGGEGYYTPTWGPKDPGRAPQAHMTPPLYLGKGYSNCYLSFSQKFRCHKE